MQQTDQNFDQIPETALAWHTAGKGAVLATVIETWGSAPRRVGGQMVINADGDMQGSVSGGCVEGAVILEAQEALDTGQNGVLEYGVSDGDAFAVGLACGGKIRVLLEPIGDTGLPPQMLRDLVDARANRVPVAYVVDLDSYQRRLAFDGYDDLFRLDRSGIQEGTQTFVGLHNPPVRVVIVGAVHIAQTLVPMLRLVGIDPIIIDPRDGFASQARFGGVDIIPDWPDEALHTLRPDARTGIVLLTHDPKLDDPALQIALASDVFYIGVLGSKRTHAKRIDRLHDMGFKDDDIARICGPIGLNIGAATPAEIAASILGQIVQTLRSPV
jgi:xanthine dehydrogenase accessory factor